MQIINIPGISGSTVKLDANLFHPWKDKDLHTMKLVELHQKLKEFITEECIIIAKSFGAAVALSYYDVTHDPRIKAFILWGPAVNVGISNVASLLEAPLGTLQSSTEIVVAPSISIPLLILHGTKDETIPYDHAESLCTRLKATLLPLQSAGHSDHQEEVLSIINRYIKKFTS